MASNLMTHFYHNLAEPEPSVLKPQNRKTAEPQNRRTAEPQNRETETPQNRKTAELKM